MNIAGMIILGAMVLLHGIVARIEPELIWKLNRMRWMHYREPSGTNLAVIYRQGVVCIVIGAVLLIGGIIRMLITWI